MEILKFMNKNKNLEYEKIKVILENNYNLEIRSGKGNNYYMINTTKKSDFEISLVRQCTGVIIDKNTNDILHYFGEMAYEIDNDYNNNIIDLKNVNLKNCYISKYKNGYVIKVFNYNNEWKFATSKHTNIKHFKVGNEVLYNMFKKSILKTFNTINDFLNSLDNIYCYSFILSNNSIYIINKINLENLNEEFSFTNYFPLYKYKYENVNKNNEDEKFIIIEKKDIYEKQTINKIHLSIKELKNLFHKNICKYNDKCFENSCKLIHIIRSNINKNTIYY